MERNFGYPLLYGVPRSGMECNGGGLRATLFAMERSGIANNVSAYTMLRGCIIADRLHPCNMGGGLRRNGANRSRICRVRRCAQNNYHKLFEQFYTAPVPYIFSSFVSISVHVIFRPNGLESSVPISLKLSTVKGVSGANTFGGQLSF